MNSLFDLSGKVAVVTGGNGGIGLGMATGLAQAGATLVIAGRDEHKNLAAVTQLQTLVCPRAFTPKRIHDGDS